MLEQVCMVVTGEVLGEEENANTADITLNNSFEFQTILSQICAFVAMNKLLRCCTKYCEGS